MSKVTLDLPELPPGFEYTGEYRTIEAGDYYTTGLGFVSKMDESEGFPMGFIVRPVPWRAELLGHYCFLGEVSTGKIKTIRTTENGLNVDYHRYSQGNYFRTGEQAQKALDKILNILKEK